MTTSKTSVVVAVFGWVVAFLSLGLNYTKFIQEREEKQEAKRDRPVYEKSLKTYDPAILPPNILAIKEPIPHEFGISHKSGQTIRDLSIEFASPDAEISEVTLLEGQADAETRIASGAHEAKVKKLELLPSTTLRGRVITNGIAKVSMAVSASNVSDGTMASAANTRSPEDSRWSWNSIIAAGIVGLLVLVLLGSTYFAIPALKTSELYESASRNDANYFLLVSIVLVTLISSVAVPFMSELFWGIALYILVTEGRRAAALISKIEGALDRLSSARAEDDRRNK